MSNYKSLAVILLLSVFLPITTFACGYSYISQCADYLRINTDGSILDHNLASCTYRATFQNKDFGTVESFSIDLAEVITWESCDNNVMAAHLYYRIYPIGTSPGAFNDFSVNNIISESSGAYRTKRRQSTDVLNLLDGLSGGSYVIETYIEVDVDTNNSGTPNDFLTTDNNGDYFQAFFTIEGGTTGGDLMVDFENQSNVSCRNGNDGTVSAIASSGTAPYTYAWSNGNTSETATDLEAAQYFVTVTDSLNLTGIGSVTIQQPASLQAGASSVNASSSSATDGTATSNPSGGTPPFTYFWSNNETTASINNLSAGSYTVTVTDANDCSVSQSVTVSFSATGPSGYCTTTGIFPWVDWMTRVEFSGIDNTSTKAPYTDYSSQNALVSTSGSYEITIENGFSYQTYDEYFRVWIDYNRNGTFEEPAEIAFSSTLNAPPLGSAGGMVMGNIQIPSNASLGTTRMRVSLKRGAYATPCESIPNGEVEDYSITIEQGSPVLCAISASATNISCNNAGTTEDPADDTFSFALNVTGTGTGSGWTADVNGSAITGTYGTAINVSNLSIADGDVILSITDNGDNACIDSLTVSPPETCSTGSNCAISTSVSEIVCSDNGTNADDADDTFSFLLDVTGTDASTGWIASYNGTTMTGAYGVPIIFGPFPIAVGDVEIIVQDSEEAACIATEMVSPPSTCSVPPVLGEANCVSVSNFPWFDWIAGVSIGTIAQSSSKSPYSDFTANSTDVVQGESIDITLTSGFSWFTYNEYWAVWIDYNQDNIFDETTELAYSADFSAPANGTLTYPTTGQINVPATALLGSTKMRVIMKRDAAPSPCETVSFGEVEDYTVNITAAGGNGFAVNHILRLEVNEFEENADINFYGLIPAEMIATDIEKSYDGTSYFTLSENNPTDFGDNSIHLREMDYDLEKGNNYYRVKVTAGDGSVLYSNPQLVYFEPKPDFTLYPNPAQDFVMIDLPEMNGERVDISIVGQFGQVLYNEKRDTQNERALRVSTADFIDGLYFVRVQIAGKRVVGKPLMIFRL